MYQDAGNEMTRALEQLRDIVELADVRVINSLYLSASSNGLQKSIADLQALSESEVGLQLAGDDLIQAICDLQTLGEALQIVATILEGSCNFAYELLNSLIGSVISEDDTEVILQIAGIQQWCDIIGSSSTILGAFESVFASAIEGVRLDASPSPSNPDAAFELTAYVITFGPEACRAAVGQASNLVVDQFIGLAVGQITTRLGAAARAADRLGWLGDEFIEAWIDRAAGLVRDGLDALGLEVVLAEAVSVVCDQFTGGLFERELELNGALSGPFPAIGTLDIPPAGAGGPAIYLCDQSGAGTSSVQFDFSTPGCNGQLLSSSASVSCGNEDVVFTIGDNGPALDDIFELRVDGVSILTSSVPVRSISETVSLSLGIHGVEMIGRAAPDGIGTYFLNVSGADFLSGGPPLSGSNLNAGVVFSWQIDVTSN